MEASALTHASRRGLLARRSPLLRVQGDARLIAMARSGNAGAFETIVDRYQGRLLGFCRQMLGSTEDAEDVLQEVFVNAYKAMLADEREINLRPWLYRIARNRCLNHLRKPTADAQESMDMVPEAEAASTAERVHNREEFRQLLSDVGKLPETQRSALLLREMDALTYEEIAQAMDTSVPSVKSLLVRARISLAEASQARQLTCGEVRLELAEAAEGLRKASGPVRRHVRDCEGCADFRAQIRSTDKALAALAPVGPLLAFKSFVLSKLGFGGGAAGSGSTGVAGSSAATGAAGAAGAAGAGGAVGAVGSSVGAALGGGGAASGIGAVGGALGTKAVAGVVTAAVLTAGAVEVKPYVAPESNPVPPKVRTATGPAGDVPTLLKRDAGPMIDPAQEAAVVQQQPTVAPPPAPAPAPAAEPSAEPAQHQPPAETAPPVEAAPAATAQPAASGSNTDDEGPEEGIGVNSGVASGGGAPPAGETVVVTVGSTSPPPPPPAEEAPEATEPAPPPPAEEAPAEEPAPPPPPAE